MRRVEVSPRMHVLAAAAIIAMWIGDGEWSVSPLV